jgi:yecA family protein
MDGLFSALIAGPKVVSPGEYLPLLWGGALPDENVSFNVAHVNAMISLLMRHWNSIKTDLDTGAVLVPVVFDSGVDEVPGRPWARGFMRGVNSSPQDWEALFDDESQRELRTISQMAGGTNTRSSQEPPAAANAKAPIDSMAAGLKRAYLYFRIRRNIPGI